MTPKSMRYKTGIAIREMITSQRAGDWFTSSGLSPYSFGPSSDFLKRRKKLAKGTNIHQPLLPTSWYRRTVMASHGIKPMMSTSDKIKKGLRGKAMPPKPKKLKNSRREARPLNWQKRFLKSYHHTLTHSHHRSKHS